MEQLSDTLKLFVVIVATLFVKFLMTEIEPNDEETKHQKKMRRRQAVGGMLAGGMLAYYGHEPFIALFNLDPSARNLTVIFLAFFGEHIVREAMRAEFIKGFFNRIGGSK